MLEPLFLALILSAVHFFSSQISSKLEKYHSDLLSLSSGVFVSVLFLEMFPRAVEAENGFMMVLIGFVIFHLAEKYVYQHKEKSEIRKKELGMLDAGGFFIDSFIDGLILVFAFSINLLTGYIVFIPLVLHKLSSSIAFVHLVGKFRSRLVEVGLATSVFLGALVGMFAPIPESLLLPLFASLVGTLTYLVVRDMIPRGNKGNPTMFLVGVAITIAFYLGLGVI